MFYVIAQRVVIEHSPEVAGHNRVSFSLTFYCGVGHTSNSLHSALQFHTEHAAQYYIDHDLVGNKAEWIVLEIH